MLYSLIAMQLEQIKTIKKLVDRFETDPVFRYTCGINVLDRAPSASTFSRFLDKNSSSNELERDFESLILKAKELNIIDGKNVVIDSTKLNAYEKSKPSPKLKKDGVSPNCGAKNDTDGNKIKWFGFKLTAKVNCH